MEDLIKYSIGGFFLKKHLFLVLLEMMRNYPQYFRDNVRVSSVYDSFPNVIWNSGRICLGKTLKPEEMKRIISFYNHQDIGVRYTYTNPFISKEHLADKQANLSLELAHSKKNGVILSSPILEKYIRKHYPKYQIIQSVTTVNYKKSWIKKRIAQVDLLVLQPEFNRDISFIRQLPREKVEILVNEVCMPFCKNKEAHYQAVALDQLCRNRVSARQYYVKKTCPLQTGELQDRISNKEILPLCLSFNEVKYLNKQFSIENFKLADRALSDQYFVNMIDTYLVRSDYSKRFKKLFQ